MNIREITKLTPNYCEINREERNYAAIFFAALCKPGNTKSFLRKFFNYDSELGEDFGIYFEYAYLRDLWSKIDCEETKKDVIRNLLPIKNIGEILDQPIVEINRKFGVAGKPSEEFIQFPGKWAIVKYNQNFSDNDDFLKICRFKWSFNIKPDIVIHLDKDRAICIEAKYTSIEGQYPSSEREKEIFRKRGIKPVKQLELQKYMMEELLGIETDFMFLVYKKEISEKYKVLSWKEAFDNIDMCELPEFAIKMTQNVL